MKASLRNQLNAYSALSALAAISPNSADAQIIHTEVNYKGGYETYDIDIDGNGVVDFSVSAIKSTNSFSGYNIRRAQVDLQGANSNAAVGQMQSTYGYSFGVLSALSAGFYNYATNADFVGSGVLAGKVDLLYPILSTNTFTNTFPCTTGTGTCTSTYKTYTTIGTFPLEIATFGYFGTGSELYAGIQFDIDGEIHYGWLRFKDVKQNGSSWTLVDMAYQEEPDRGITTGTTVSINDLAMSAFNIKSTKDYIIVESNEQLSKIEVINMQGQIVASDVISSTTATVPNTFSKGIYIVNLYDTKGKAVTRKIAL